MPQSQDSTGATTTIDPDDFVAVIDNPYFTLEPGTTFIYESPDGTSVTTFFVTRQTKEILGVTCIVVEDTVTQDGKLAEKTFDYFAQDIYGNVWYFGEATKEFDNGHVSREGSWLAGVDGAEPGIVMLASPTKGDEYNQENAPGVAEDSAEVVSLHESVSVPYGSFPHDVLETEDTNPLAGSVELKFYGPGVGLLLEVDPVTGEVQEQLVKIKIDGTSESDTLVGKAGTDELNGYAGDDHLNGLAGNDTIDGGRGNDTLDGGLGSDVFVFESLNEGKDTITDFQAGAGGDVLDIHELLAGFDGSSDADDFVHLVESGGNTTVQVDANGGVGGGKFTDVCVLAGVTGATVDSLVDDGNLVLA
jgi:hypothetical protein